MIISCGCCLKLYDAVLGVIEVGKWISIWIANGDPIFAFVTIIQYPQTIKSGWGKSYQKQIAITAKADDTICLKELRSKLAVVLKAPGRLGRFANK